MFILTGEFHREPGQPRQVQIGVLLAPVLVGDGARKRFEVAVDVFGVRPERPPPVQFKVRFQGGGIADALDDVGGMELIEPDFSRHIGGAGVLVTPNFISATDVRFGLPT